MTDDVSRPDGAEVVRAFLRTLEARDWEAWSALLHPDVVYELPQSRERIRGRGAYLRFNQTYPGDWHLSPRVALGDDRHGAAWFDWSVDGEEQDDAAIGGQVWLDLDDAGLVTRVVDLWPEPYDPPERPAGLVERW